VASAVLAVAVILAFTVVLWVAAPWIVDRYFDLKYGKDA
jgi:hypothetical protein